MPSIEIVSVNLFEIESNYLGAFFWHCYKPLPVYKKHIHQYCIMRLTIRQENQNKKVS